MVPASERDYWRNIAQTVAPDYPVVAVPVDTLNEVSQRAELAETVVTAAAELVEQPNHGSEMRLRVALNVYRREIGR